MSASEATPPEVRTQRLAVTRTARYHVAGSGPETWFVLHGYGQLALDFLQAFLPLGGTRRRFVAPEGLSRFYLRRGTGTVGASWMTREERADEIHDAVAWLDRVAAEEGLTALGDARPGLTGILGFSQGAPLAARWAALGAVRPQRVLLMGSGLPPDLDLAAHAERLGRVRWTLVHGERDETVPRATLERDLERCRAAGLQVHLESFSGGHELPAAVVERLLA